jgi:hypothetical protein
MKQNPSIDDLIKYTVKEDGLETPSDDFSDKVMRLVEVQQPLVYRPLISKYMLAAILGGVVLMVLFMLTQGFLPQSNYPYIDNLLKSVSEFHFDITIPSHISYIITSALILLMIQVIIIGKLYKKMYR